MSKAAILTELNAPLQVLDIEPAWVTHDTVCANGQVLVDIIASGICGAQLQEIGGHKGNAAFLPHLMGHEGVGRVRKVGPGVNVQMIGRKVVCHWRKGAGPEAFQTARYEGPKGMTIGGGHVTTLCEQAVVSANRLTVVPDDVPDDLCALLGCGLSTALGTIEQEAHLRMGETVLIFGAGGLGLNLIQAARIAGATTIAALDITDDKAHAAAQLGATAFVNVRKQSIADVMHTLGLKGFDVIVETSGTVEALEAAVPLLSDTGRLIMVGQPKPGESFRLMAAADMFHGEGKTIKATQGGKFNPTSDIPRYVAMWRAGLIDLEPMISHRIGLEEINDGIELVRKGQAGRIMVCIK